jgi:hypothetical protein
MNESTSVEVSDTETRSRNRTIYIKANKYTKAYNCRVHVIKKMERRTELDSQRIIGKWKIALVNY